MKTSTLLAVVGCFVSFAAFTQHDHHETESLFIGKGLYDFELQLGITNHDYQNGAKIAFIDQAYQNFQDSIDIRLDLGEEITEAQFNNEYANLVSRVQQELATLPPTIPVPSSPRAPNGPCENMDFEQGDVSGWTLSRGDVDGSAPYSFVNEIPAVPGAYHQIFAGGNDAVTGIPCVNPLNGNFSVRLGNGTGTGARAARMTQTFLVDNTNFMFTYSYAVIFQSPGGHTLNQLPYFTVRVTDQNGANVPCGEYSVIADGNNAQNYQTTNWGGSVVLFQNWQTVFTNLSAFIGQNVTIEFTSGDCSLTGHFGYAYIDASCSMQQVIATQNTICSGDPTTLTAPPGAASYLWSNGATTQSITVTAGGTYTCTLTPFQGGGCSIDLDITIIEYPEPVANFVSNTTVICPGDGITFTDQSTIPAPGVISTYQWDFGDGTVTPASSGAIGAVPNTSGTYLVPTHTYTASGTYTVQLTVATADGCTDTYTSTITVNPLPNVVAGPDQTVCDGGLVTLSGAGAASYSWDQGVWNNVAFYPSVGNTTYTVTGTDANGCVNTDQVIVTVNPLPNVNAGADQTVCDGAQVTLTGSGAVNYAWDNGITNNVAFTPPVGNTTYTVTGTDANGCVNTDQVIVTVNPLPAINAGADQTVCADAQVTLSGSGGVSYVWNNGVINNVAFSAPIGTTNYTVTGTDANGCQNTDIVAVTVNALPAVVAGPNQTVCEGNSVILSGAGATSYVWNLGVLDGIPFVPPVGTTTYTVTGTDGNGCVNTDQVNVVVNPLPNVGAGPDQAVCEGSTVILSGSGAVNYAWTNGVVDGVPFVPAVGTITYTVTGNDGNGCFNTDQVQVMVHALPVVNAGSDQTVCENTFVTLSGAGAVSYTWDNGVVNGVAFQSPVGSTNYTVLGTDVNGCQNTDQVTINVNALPAVSAGPDVVVCDQTPVTLSGSGATSYVWSGGITNGVPFVVPVGSYTYNVTGTDANGCQNGDAVQVTVNPNPVVDAGANQSLCEGEMVTLIATGSPNLNWVGGYQNGVPFQQGVGTVTYTVNDFFSTGCTASDVVVVTVHPRPDVRADGAEVCEGEGVTLTGSGADSYSWNNGVINGVEFFPTVTADYTVIGTTIFGCKDSATVKVIVHPLPYIDFKILKPSLMTSASTTGFDNLSVGAVSFNWNFGDGSPISYLFEPTHEFPYDQAGTYEVILTGETEYGCIAEKVKYVYVLQDYTIYVPNTFTPDGNGKNEFFKPVMDGFDEDKFTLYIFNRWGDLIFESHDMDYGWDGSFKNVDRVQDGVFTWKIEAGLKDSADSKVFVGHVTLLK